MMHNKRNAKYNGHFADIEEGQRYFSEVTSHMHHAIVLQQGRTWIPSIPSISWNVHPIGLEALVLLRHRDLACNLLS